MAELNLWISLKDVSTLLVGLMSEPTHRAVVPQGRAGPLKSGLMEELVPWGRPRGVGSLGLVYETS